MNGDWKDYQEEAAGFFRSLGLDAETNVTLKGVRTTHDVDVRVRSHHVGFDVTWIVECKHWNTKVSKLHVLALREIVADLGADRGILLAENGFQSGAAEAAALTNVHLTSLANVRTTASTEVFSMRLRELYDRIEAARERYWNISKRDRIEHGLRPDVGFPGYSGTATIELAQDLIAKAFRGVYPIRTDPMRRLEWAPVPEAFDSVEQVVKLVDTLTAELEGKLTACEKLLHK